MENKVHQRAESSDLTPGDGSEDKRNRLFFCADTLREQDHQEQQRPAADEGGWGADGTGRCGASGLRPDPDGGQPSDGDVQRSGEHGLFAQDCGTGEHRDAAERGIGSGWLDPHEARSVAEAGATRGFWADCDWWFGRDGKYRPIKSGVFPLAHGYPNRVGLLRLAGDAIVVPAAQAFIEAYLELTLALH